MRKLFLSLLALLCVTTAFSMGGFHGGFHSSPHISSYHSSPHISSFHESYHSSTSSHIESHPTYHPVGHEVHPTYHPNGYYYYILANNFSHKNDTIKASTEDMVKDEVAEKTGESSDNDFLIILSVLGVALIVGIIAVISV